MEDAKKYHLDPIKKNLKTIESNDDNQQNHAELALLWKKKLDNIQGQFTQIEKYVGDTSLMEKPFDNTLYDIETKPYSKEDVAKLLTKLKSQDREEKAINALEFNAALTKIDTDDQDDFRAYLNGVLDGTIDPTKDQYTPKSVAQFTALCKDYPNLKGYICFTCAKNNTAITNKELEKKKKTIGDTDKIGSSNTANVDATKTTETYTDAKEAFAK